MVKHLTIALALCATSLSACATIPAPATLANSTKIDEQSINTLELAYKTWRLAVETGIHAGYIKGQLATHVAQLDDQIYSALVAAETAYTGANAADYNTAVANFNTALTVGYSAIGGK